MLTRVLIVAATTSGNVLNALGSRRWDRAINALVPAALIAAMIAHAFPFFVSSLVLYPIDLKTGFSAVYVGFSLLSRAVWDPFFEAFSLPLIAAFVGLVYQRRPGWMGSLAPLVCSVVGLTSLGICLLLGQAAVGLRLLHCRGQLPARGRGIRRQIDSPTTQRRNVGCERRGTIRACGLGLTGTAFAIPQELVALAGETRMRSS